MNRQQLARLLRAACDITKDPEVLVLGSQTVLGTWDEEDLPPAATASMEVDIAFLDDGPDRGKAEQVEGAIGEFSQMHRTEGVYAEAIAVSTAILPDGWQARLRTWDLESSKPARPLFLESHDLCVAKLLAGRLKDREFVDALLSQDMVQPDVIDQRLDLVPPGTHDVAVHRARQFLRPWMSPEGWYINVNPFEQFYLPEVTDANTRSALEQLGAIGISGTNESSSEGHFTMRLVADPE